MAIPAVLQITSTMFESRAGIKACVTSIPRLIAAPAKTARRIERQHIDPCACSRHKPNRNPKGTNPRMLITISGTGDEPFWFLQSGQARMLLVKATCSGTDNIFLLPERSGTKVLWLLSNA